MKLSLIVAIAATAAAVALSSTNAFALSCKGGGCPPGPYGGPGNKGGSAVASSVACGDELAYMRTVRPAQVEALGEDDRITVTPICDGEEPGPLRASGNAGALRAPIGLNPVLVAALADDDYTNQDVVAVRMTEKGAILYVVHYDY
jgi:hypothetical protein